MDINACREHLFRDGFVHIPKFLNASEVNDLKFRFEPLFAGNFTTGIYPDEWHWRKEISKVDAFREIVNAWKSDIIIAKMVLSEKVGRLAADLMNWPGSRVAQDDLLWKPAGSGGVGFHRDSTYISKQFSPLKNNSLTIWVALDDCDETTGVVRYVKGSHINYENFGVAEKNFFQTDNKLLNLESRTVAPSVKAGDILCHHQDVLHGSSKNMSKTRPRRALGIHLIRSDVEWTRDSKVDYIYGRYKLIGEKIPRTEFFPITYLKPNL